MQNCSPLNHLDPSAPTGHILYWIKTQRTLTFTMTVLYWTSLLLLLPCFFLPAVTAISHGHDHIRIPTVDYIKQQLIKQGSMMRGEELENHAQAKHIELLDHIHSTHAHEHKYGQINSMHSPLPRPKGPLNYEIKNLDAAHTFTIRRSFNLKDLNKDGVLSRDELIAFLKRGQKDISEEAVRELLQRADNANLEPPKYMYVPKENFLAGQTALIGQQKANMKHASKRISEFLEKNPNRTAWSPYMKERFQTVNSGIQQQSNTLTMDKRYQKLVDKGQSESDVAKELLQNISTRNLILHPWERHKVTDPNDPNRKTRVAHAQIFHEHSPEKYPGDGGHEMVELVPHDDNISPENAGALAANARADVEKVIGRSDELFDQQDVNRDGKIDFKEYFWRVKKQKMEQHAQLEDQQRKLLSEPRKHGYFNNYGFWIPSNEESENDDRAKKQKEAQEKEREAILSQWEEEL